MKYLICLALGLSTLLAAPALAQKKAKIKSKDGNAVATGSARLQPLFGGLSTAQAEALLGAGYVEKVAGSFASRAEASRFFSDKGYEYLAESKLDTALTRFNLAWLLDPKNPGAYRGLGVVASRNPTPDASIGLLSQALALAPNDAFILSDLGASHLIRYEQTKKKKDLTTAASYLQRALATDSTNANTWQQMARVYYIQEDYAKAWEAVHKSRTLSFASIDFELISELQTKMPDPSGTFK